MQLLGLLAVVEVALGQWQQWGLKESKEKPSARNTDQDQESYSILTSIMLYPCRKTSASTFWELEVVFTHLTLDRIFDDQTTC